MKIVIAPDSYKECLSAPQVARAMGHAVREALPGAEVLECPMADGGEGTLEVLASALGAEVTAVTVHDPLVRPVQAGYGRIGETAIIEVAQACGLGLLGRQERNPLTAHTRGVGELLMAAHAQGCRHFIVGLGGTVTCDGGIGMLSVPGIKEVLCRSTVELLCDVDTPFVGPHGAVAVFAPQKGARPEDMEPLEQRMVAQAGRMQAETGIDVSARNGAGAAGGLAGAFMAYADATYYSGAERIMELIGLAAAMEDAHLIITGEGKSDAQTLLGKVPYAVLQQAGETPVALLSGRIEDLPALEQAGFRPIIEVSPRNLSLAEALQTARVTSNLHLAVKALLGTSG